MNTIYTLPIYSQKSSRNRLKYSDKRIASIQRNFSPSLALIHSLHLQKCAFLYKTRYLPGFKFSSSVLSVFFLNRLTANERSQTSKAVLEIEADAVIYMHTYILSIQVFWERLSDKVHVTTPKGIVGCFWVHRFSRKFERMAGEAMDICLWVLKDSNKSIDHIPYYLSGLSRAHFFRQPLSK